MHLSEGKQRMKEFRTESKKLLDLMANSIYTNRDIFLRELVSNASDAIDKLTFVSLTDSSASLADEDLEIRLAYDRDARTITVSDNGIGMTADEMEDNLGTIAHSGSEEFKAANGGAQGSEVDIIGQFGVGFYSAFMVADNVSVLTRKYGEEQAYLWQSSGADGYTVTACEKDSCGTDVILKLKEDTEDEDYGRYLRQYNLETLVKKYSDYIRYPIVMNVKKSRPVESEDENGEKKTAYEDYFEDETMNSMVPIWQKKKDEVTDEEYDQFYMSKFSDYEKPAMRISASVEGAVTYQALMYVPARAPFDYYTKEYKKGLQLYTSGVLIMENCEDLLPDYFSFVKGVVDSQDLSLNISREMLQHDHQLRRIASNLEKKIKSELSRVMTNDREKYEKFFETFGVQIKYGVVGDYGAHKDVLKDLLRQYFYVGGMPEAVLDWTTHQNVQRVRRIQNRILSSYASDMSKHAGAEAERIRMVWNSIPAQLAKENKKFIYGAVRNGGRAKDFEVAIQWLVDAGLAYKVHRCKTPELPLKFYEDFDAFKLFFLDVGLLGALSNASPGLMLTQNDVFTEFKGAFTENYVMEQLKGSDDMGIYYFSKEHSTLEIDFLVQTEQRLVPIEVKAEENVKSKSLAQFIRTDHADKHLKGLRCSMKPYIDQGWMENIPLYSIKAYIDKENEVQI